MVRNRIKQDFDIFKQYSKCCTQETKSFIEACVVLCCAFNEYQRCCELIIIDHLVSTGEKDYKFKVFIKVTLETKQK